MRTVRSHAWSQPSFASSSRIRISSGTAIAGCVSFNWIATLSGSAAQSFPRRRNRATMSASEQRTRKYSWRNRSDRPRGVESSGYRTRVTDSASIWSDTAPKKSPPLNSPKSKTSGVAGLPEPERVDRLARRSPTTGRSYGTPSMLHRLAAVDDDLAVPRPRTTCASGTETVSPGRTTSHGSGRRQPRVRLLDLVAVREFLPEDAVVVPQAVADGRDLERRQRVDEARGQPAEPAVAQPGVRLRLQHLLPVLPRVGLQIVADELLDAQVDDVVDQRPADQELHRQVVHLLRVLPVVGLGGLDPPLGEHVAERAGDRLEPLPLRRRLHARRRGRTRRAGRSSRGPGTGTRRTRSGRAGRARRRRRPSAAVFGVAIDGVSVRCRVRCAVSSAGPSTARGVRGSPRRSTARRAEPAGSSGPRG